MSVAILTQVNGLSKQRNIHIRNVVSVLFMLGEVHNAANITMTCVGITEGAGKVDMIDGLGSYNAANMVAEPATIRGQRSELIPGVDNDEASVDESRWTLADIMRELLEVKAMSLKESEADKLHDEFNTHPWQLFVKLDKDVLISHN